MIIISSCSLSDEIQVAIGKSAQDAAKNIESYNRMFDEVCVSVHYRESNGQHHALNLLVDSRSLCEELVSALSSLTLGAGGGVTPDIAASGQEYNYN